MSECQHYEFLALDRPLGRVEQEKVRAYSTRARITATAFENEYNFGSFKGDPVKFLREWYDVFVYVANWGTHRLGLGLPAGAVDMDLARRCCGKHVGLSESKGRLVVDIQATLEEPPDFDESEPGMGELSGVRAAVLRGDVRVWYICWLLGVREGQVKDKEEEPIVPSGLGELSGELRALVEFLYFDQNLIKAAAKGTGPVAAASPADMRRLIEGLADAEKNELLMRAAKDDISAELARRLGRGRKGAATRQFRTAGDLRRDAGM
jgi:hypothetical protein